MSTNLPSDQTSGARQTPRSRRLLFPLILVLLLIVVAEGLLHALSALSPPVQAMLSRTPISQALADEVLGWRGNPQFPEHDAWGFRNARVPASAHIVTLGDSHTYGYGLNVSPEQGWPARLQSTSVGSGVSVYNMAFLGWGPVEALDLLEQALSLGPSVVLFGLYSGNDLANAYTAVYLRGRQTELRSTDTVMARRIAERERDDPWKQRMVESVNLDPPRRRQTDQRSDSPLNAIAERSQLVGLWNASGRAFRSTLTVEESVPEELIVTDRDDILLDTGQVRTILNPDYRLPRIRPTDPRIVEGQRLSIQSIRAMRDRALERGAAIAVVMLPTKELVYRDAARALGVRSEHLVSLFTEEERLWQSVRSQLTADRVPLIDPLPALREAVGRGENPYSETTDGHPSALGYRVIAEQVAADLRRLELLAR